MNLSKKIEDDAADRLSETGCFFRHSPLPGANDEKKRGYRNRYPGWRLLRSLTLGYHVPPLCGLGMNVSEKIVADVMSDFKNQRRTPNAERRISKGLRSFITVGFALALLTGCKGIATKDERAARNQFSEVARTYRPNDKVPALPTLTTNSPFSDFLTYAMLNHPEVAASYYDWAASIERITIERSRPDPKLTFEAYIAGTIYSIMPGLMTDIPGPGKLPARGRVATAESEAKYFTFKASLLQTAYGVKKAFYELHYHNEDIRVNREMLQLLTDLEQIARAENATGKGTLQDVLRTQTEAEKLRGEIANLHETHSALLAQFKAALGMTASDPEPPIPDNFAASAPDFSDEQLLEKALAQNFQLKSMEADIRRAEAAIQLARKERVPDFSAGGEVDVKAAPVVWNPQLSMTLPIWRDKIAAEIAEAQANKRSAAARLTRSQISLAVIFAEKLALYREAHRNLSVLDEQILPKARQSLELARAAYLSGQAGFLDVIDAERQLLNFELERVGALEQHEISLADLSLIIEGATPPESSIGMQPAPTVPAISKAKSGGM
jgi:cobalt-zinc-cadmium efflux system outer membrane protein